MYKPNKCVYIYTIYRNDNNRQLTFSFCFVVFLREFLSFEIGMRKLNDRAPYTQRYNIETRIIQMSALVSFSTLLHSFYLCSIIYICVQCACILCETHSLFSHIHSLRNKMNLWTWITRQNENLMKTVMWTTLLYKNSFISSKMCFTWRMCFFKTLNKWTFIMLN